jgi:hypothetical protein
MLVDLTDRWRLLNRCKVSDSPERYVLPTLAHISRSIGRAASSSPIVRLRSSDRHRVPIPRLRHPLDAWYRWMIA